MTTMTTTGGASLVARPDALFRRVLVGVDRSTASLEAARQAAVLTGVGGTLTLLSAWTLPPPVIGAVSPEFVYVADEEVQVEAAESAVAAASAQTASQVSPNTKDVRGFAWDELATEIARQRITLAAVGSHGTGRMRGILIGSTATEMVHKAPCSVLVARKAEPSFPERIVIGVDGSVESAAAYAVARYLAARFGAELCPVVARGGKEVDNHLVASIVVDCRHEVLLHEPVTALLAVSTEADLVVVGSRGLHGLRALGSVSERVAHEAHCSTLIVRDPLWRPGDGASAVVPGL
jgi:nucleotide-binding universal stress UspA family protein